MLKKNTRKEARSEKEHFGCTKFYVRGNCLMKNEKNTDQLLMIMINYGQALNSLAL